MCKNSGCRDHKGAGVVSFDGHGSKVLFPTPDSHHHTLKQWGICIAIETYFKNECSVNAAPRMFQNCFHLTLFWIRNHAFAFTYNHSLPCNCFCFSCNYDNDSKFRLVCEHVGGLFFLQDLMKRTWGTFSPNRTEHTPWLYWGNTSRQLHLNNGWFAVVTHLTDMILNAV